MSENIAAFPSNAKIEALAVLEDLKARVESGEVAAFMYSAITNDFNLQCRIAMVREVPVIVLLGASTALGSLASKKLT